MLKSTAASMLGLVLVLVLLTGGCALVPSGEERVKEPIADTYQPLEGADWNHRYSQELQEWRAWQDAKTAFEEEYEPEPGTIKAGSSVPEDRIQEPQPTAYGEPRPEPRIEEEENSLRISE